MSDSDDAVCGHPTEGGDGPPCQNRAGENGRCWIPSHNDPGAENPQGRPPKFSDERAREAVAAISSSYSTTAVEEKIGVGRGTIDNGPESDDDWLSRDLTYVDEDGEERHFSEAFMRARGDTHGELIQRGLYDDEADSSFIKFILATSYGHKKTEKQELEHSGEVDGFEFTVGVVDGDE